MIKIKQNIFLIIVYNFHILSKILLHLCKFKSVLKHYILFKLKQNSLLNFILFRYRYIKPSYQTITNISKNLHPARNLINEDILVSAFSIISNIFQNKHKIPKVPRNTLETGNDSLLTSRLEKKMQSLSN